MSKTGRVGHNAQRMRAHVFRPRAAVRGSAELTSGVSHGRTAPGHRWDRPSGRSAPAAPSRAAPDPDRTRSCPVRDRARRTSRSLSRSRLHAKARPVRDADRAVLVLQLSALDDVVGQVVVVRVGGEGQVRHHRAQMQHRRELNAELAGGVHRHAQLKRFADACGLHARRECRPRTWCRAGSRRPRAAARWRRAVRS